MGPTLHMLRVYFCSVYIHGSYLRYEIIIWFHQKVYIVPIKIVCIEGKNGLYCTYWGYVYIALRNDEL